MKRNALFSFLLLPALLSGCGSPAAPASVPPPAALTPVHSPTASPVLPTSAPTAHPPLRTNGPYLVYLRQAADGQELVIMDADGQGQKSFTFPVNADAQSILPSLTDSLSPDGKWLAYYTGTAGALLGHVGKDTADLALNLMDLTTGESKGITPLLSADYPDNFAPAVRQLKQADVSVQGLEQAFIYGITHSLAWSPDGRTLAFAGQMDGLSSDLYTYDTATGSIQRLSSGPEEVQWIDWSPDGSWILDASAAWAGAGMSENLYATSRDGKNTQRLTGNTGITGKPVPWLAAHSFLDFQTTNGPGTHALRLVNAGSGDVAAVWDDPYEALAVDVERQWAALYGEPAAGGLPGLRLIDLNNLQRVPVKTPDASHLYGSQYDDIQDLGLSDEKLFVIRDETDSNLYYLSTTGSLTPLGIQAASFSLSPDGKYLIALGENLQVYTTAGIPIREIRLPAGIAPVTPHELLWRPDSSGAFILHQDFQSGFGSVVMFEVASGLPEVVESRFSNVRINTPRWVTPGGH